MFRRMTRSSCNTRCSNILLVLPFFLTIITWSAFQAYKSTNEPQEPDHVREDILGSIRQKIIPPPSRDRNLSRPDRVYHSQEGQDEFVDNLLNHKKNGFFIECGAMDGQYFSNSLFFEVRQGWSGLLIEANPDYYQKLVSTQRQCYILNACLSPTNQSNELVFQMNKWKGMTGLAGKDHNGDVERVNQGSQINILCHPLHIILQAMGRTHVDYFSLDVEGAEIGVLKTIPFDQITIDVLTVEYNVPGEPSLPRLNQIIEHMLGTGLYEMVEILPHDKPINLGLDVIFKRKTIK